MKDAKNPTTQQLATQSERQIQKAMTVGDTDQTAAYQF